MAKALAYLRENMHRKLPVGEVAAHVGRSGGRFKTAIRAATGQTFTSYLLSLRTEEAKRLLTQTEISVGEIARSVGFSTSRYFAATFRRAAGCPPREYRDLHREPLRPSEPRTDPGVVLFEGDFSPGGFDRAWVSYGGRWSVVDGELRGESTADLFALARCSLPAAFEVRLRLRQTSSSGSHSSRPVLLGFTAPHLRFTGGYWLHLGDPHTRACSLLRDDNTVAVRAGTLPAGTWMDVGFRCVGNSLSLSLDGKEVLRHEEMLPLPLRERAHFVLGGWDAAIRVRQATIASLRPTSSRGRTALGDAHVVEGDWERALEVYERELDRSREAAGETDLLFKIGMTYLRLGLRVRARAFLERFAPRRPADVWGIMAASLVLEMRSQDLSDDELAREIRRVLALGETPAARTLAIELIGLCRNRPAEDGNYERSALVSRLLFDAAPPFSQSASVLARATVDLWNASGRYREAEEFGGRAIRSGRLDEGQQGYLAMSVALSAAGQGGTSRARSILGRPSPSEDRNLTAVREIRRGMLLQARGDLRGALESYRRTAQVYSDVEGQAFTASANAAVLLAVAGRHAEAARLARDAVGGGSAGMASLRLELRTALQVVAERHRVALDLVEPARPGPQASLRDKVRHSLLVCMLAELAGDAARAAANLEAMERTFAGEAAHRWLGPVLYLAGKAPEDRLRREVRNFGLLLDYSSASLFWMLGRVMKRRRENARARRLFRCAIEADPLNYWPSLLARRELGRLTPSMKRFLVR